ncbi:MAG: hypothetical protein KAJ63_07090 [Methyloprofundus sp.]|nr:hypothetical protein [Methyloprofundus sp.]
MLVVVALHTSSGGLLEKFGKIHCIWVNSHGIVSHDFFILIRMDVMENISKTLGYLWIASLALGSVEAAVINPVSGSTGDLLLGDMLNVIDGVVDPASYLIVGSTIAPAPFTGSYSVTFDLGGLYDLDGMDLWNNAGGAAYDGEGIKSFSLNFLDDSSVSTGGFSGNATDDFGQQTFAFSDSGIQYVELNIFSNHSTSARFRDYVAFNEIQFQGDLASVDSVDPVAPAVPALPVLWMFGVGLVGMVGTSARKQG